MDALFSHGFVVVQAALVAATLVAILSGLAYVVLHGRRKAEDLQQQLREQMDCNYALAEKLAAQRRENHQLWERINAANPSQTPQQRKVPRSVRRRARSTA
jgi:type II secretory pathway component PulJ